MAVILLAVTMLPLLSSSSSSSMPSSPVLDPVLAYIDAHQNEFVQRLGEWIAVESDSGDPARWGEIHRLLNMTADRIKEMGGKVELADIGSRQLSNGESIAMPPVLLAEFERDPNKPTLCIYGHLDVQPAKKEDGWTTDPYTLTELNGNLYGRGATDNKGPLLAWLHAVETYKATQQEVPVNVKFIIEGMEEVGSDGLDELTRQRNETFFSDVDYIVISDNVWLSTKPALTYGTRGSSYFFVEVEGPNMDLHSGVFGGSIQEPMIDLIALLGSLVDPKGKILIPKINEAVAPLTEEERNRYKDIHFDIEEMKKHIDVKSFIQDNKEAILMARWRYPSLSIHGIQGAFSGLGSKTVIPRRVIGKFSIRHVPNMEPSVVERQVKEHLHEVFAKHKSPNSLKVSAIVGAKPWAANLNDPQYIAGQKAVKAVFGVEPELIREGSTIPIATNFQEITGKSVMMLPIGGHDDGEHSQNEKISRYNFIQGTKLFAVFFNELSRIQKDQ